MRKEKARHLRIAAMLTAQSAPYNAALAMPSLFPLWTPDTAYGGENEPQIVRYPIEEREQLYRCKQPHTSQAGWEPPNTQAMWVAINNSQAGTEDDPIPAVRGMEYEYGKHYRDPEDGKTYLCKRIGEEDGGKIVLQFLPHELIGQYFEEAK